MNYSIQPREFVVGDVSPFTGSREVMHRYHQWHVIMTWNHIRHAQAHAIMAHFNRGRGGRSIFQIPIFNYRAKVGTKSGSVTLSGAHSANTTSLTITGGSGSLAAGDWIRINQTTDVPRLYQVTTDESGNVITINPGLRVAQTSGSTVHIFGGSGLFDSMELPSDPSFPSAMPSKAPGLFQPFTLELVTALRRSP
jgi:hypothetical protein